MVAVAFAVIAALAIGAILATTAALGLRLRVSDAGSDREKANGGGGNAGFDVHVGSPGFDLIVASDRGRRLRHFCC